MIDMCVHMSASVSKRVYSKISSARIKQKPIDR